MNKKKRKKKYTKRNARSILSVWATMVLAACAPAGGDSDEPIDVSPGELTAEEAAVHFDAGLEAALLDASITVDAIGETVIVDGTVATGDALVTLDLHVTRVPFELSGSASVEAEGQLAAIEFSATDEQGIISIDGEITAFNASLPANAEFALANAMWVLDAFIPGLPVPALPAGCNNLNVTDNGAGSVTIDGDCSVGGVTVDFDMVTIDATQVPPTIDGTVTVTDGNNNEIIVEFNGTDATVTVNGQEVATVTWN